MIFLKRFLACVMLLTALLAAIPSGFAGEPRLYTASVTKESVLWAEKSTTSRRVTTIPAGKTFDIYEVDPLWVKVGYNGKTGHIKRERLQKVIPVDPANTPPYGVDKSEYMAVAAGVTPVLDAPNISAKALVTLQAGAKISILDITDGWARVVYWRQYAYVDTRTLKDLTPVSPKDIPISGETPIAAFTSFYSVKDTKENEGRMKNIAVACERLSRIYEPGEKLDFNTHIGPYSRANGYFQAPVLLDGGTSLGYGGGTCQVSSTFYNTVLQLPGVEIVYRRPHGPSGAKYLPHGVDAAVGSDSLNLIIRNNYDFPVRVEASAQDGALFMCIWKV